MTHTWKDHPDYNGLVQAVENIKQIALTINENIRDAESTKRILELETQIIDLNRVTYKKKNLTPTVRF